MLSLLLLLLPFISAQSFTFIGCTSQRGAGGFSTIATNTVTCASTCQTRGGYRYSFFQEDANTSVNDNCFCTNSFPSASFISSSASTSSPTSCASGNDYSSFRLSTTFVFDQCYTTAENVVSPGPIENVQTIDQCFTLCRGYTSLIINPDIATGYSCSCATYETFANPRACNRDAGFFRFTHPYPAASARLTRKRKAAARRAELERAREQYCPAGLAACKVLGSETGYECIDTANELESCGGCLYGEYGVKDGVQGVNCAALDDSSVGLGRMTCSRGQCVELA